MTQNENIRIWTDLFNINELFSRKILFEMAVSYNMSEVFGKNQEIFQLQAQKSFLRRYFGRNGFPNQGFLYKRLRGYEETFLNLLEEI